MKNNSTLIIAEAGVNHNGSLEIAEKLIVEAKKAGADAIKFQTFSTEQMVSKFAEKANYQKKLKRNESQYTMLKKLELSKDDHYKLYDICKENNIEFISSPFDTGSVDLIEKLGVNVIKIPSGEITNLPLLKYVASKKKQIILSTGMSNLGEIEEALESLASNGSDRISLLHCVSEYPAPMSEINLRAMLTLKSAFKLPVGYSDHSDGIEIAIAAVALGAVIIEKHFTLDRKMRGPDHKSSLEPNELKSMVQSIRNVEMALGSGIKKAAPCELENLKIARKSLVASKTIVKGQQIREEDIAIKRPGYGIQPKFYSKIIGRVANTDVTQDEVITWEKLR